MPPCAIPATGGAPEITFVATPDQARHALAHVMAALAACGLDRERMGEVELTLAEVVNNIVEHGYAGRACGLIRIAWDLAPDDLSFLIRDRGRCIAGGLPPGRLPDLAVPRSELPEGGFGWTLIRSMASELSYERAGGENRLGLRFAFPEATS
jgi:serine/threonine-protein kinase RsbW